jgi:hypothetical protein
MPQGALPKPKILPAEPGLYIDCFIAMLRICESPLATDVLERKLEGWF